MAGSGPHSYTWAQNILQRLLFEIAKDAQFFEGKGGSAAGTIAAQFKQALTALLYTAANAQTDRSLIIYEEKVRIDIGAPSIDTIVAASTPVTNAYTSKLQELVNTWAFVPVLNCLIVDSNFTAGAIAGNQSTDDFKFDLGVTTTGEGGNLTSPESHLVFPMKVLIADDGESKIEGGGLQIQGDKKYNPGSDITLPLEVAGTVHTVGTVGTIDVYQDNDGTIFEENTDGQYVMVGNGLYAKYTDMTTVATNVGVAPGGTGSIAFQLNIIFASFPTDIGAIPDPDPIKLTEETVQQLQSGFADSTTAEDGTIANRTLTLNDVGGLVDVNVSSADKTKQVRNTLTSINVSSVTLDNANATKLGITVVTPSWKPSGSKRPDVMLILPVKTDATSLSDALVATLSKKAV